MRKRFFMKKKVSLVLIAAVIMTMAFQPMEAAALSGRPFTDVTKNSWYYNDVYNSYYNGIFKGTSGHEFSPRKSISRGMFVTVLYRLAGSPQAGADNIFSDVNDDSYYKNAILWANETGIAQGYPGGYFCPDSELTREQAAKMIYNFYLYKTGQDIPVDAGDRDVSESAGNRDALDGAGDQNVSESGAGDQNVSESGAEVYSYDGKNFEDISDISGWSKKYIAWAYDEGLITGKLEKDKMYMSPLGKLTRSEACAILNRYSSKFSGQKMQTYADNVDFKSLYQVNNTKCSFWWGANYDSLNRPAETLRFQSNEGTKYNALAVDTSTAEKVIYLTFDEGYEAGYTGAILDTLKQKNVDAVFFITGHYYKMSKNYVKRMIEEGHIVGNHSYSHPSAGTCSLTLEKEYNEINSLQEILRNDLDYEMTLFRSPSGIYSERTLALLTSMNMKAVFWSFGYLDYDTSKQPSKAAALSKLKARLHPGAVYLLHAVSSTNTAILGDFIDYARSMGYRFELVENN